MKVIVDTDVWSEALRKKDGNSAHVNELRSLIEEGRVQMIGPIRQEILSGIREESHFERIDKSLRAFPDKEIGTDEFVQAAKFYNLCRGKGIQGSNTDFLLVACSVSWGYPILTKDKDFQLFRKLIAFELLDPSQARH